ncbi:hypothetical protein COCSUDRAFT_62894 [Coccomyxa subellipsoidea C-169]|uniref:CHCH domain-containing protein n=1 Tax=Coccomyxa subellipsoidea (strain C-169) TaxID=574566 RepID=I0YY86_COCSC|nr:hypothetical protein COCSUDRAFT_62894 [Coccomyxa subellipsoidea C-169]EIE23355.1 hypothetical protein COCSUDRAFT_62894 [Coccomyxa subellipsoidea C-169]|eukprot:XP_005647899.1 hypothetical protein COCSUDRAFT_62894 [Coccomyxa subellipsoidea C-169]
MSDRQAEPQQPEEDHKIDEQIAEALACPCVDDLRSGPCGKSFEAAFSCFLRHQAKHKDDEVDMDCLGQFEAMQQCMVQHPQAFAEFKHFQTSGEADRMARDAGGR